MFSQPNSFPCCYQNLKEGNRSLYIEVCGTSVAPSEESSTVLVTGDARGSL